MNNINFSYYTKCINLKAIKTTYEILVQSLTMNVFNCTFILPSLVTFLFINIASFSWFHLRGSSLLGRYYAYLIGSWISLLSFVSAQDTVALWLSWSISLILFAKLIQFQSNWSQSKQSGLLALKYFGVGALLLGLSLAYLSYSAKSILVSDCIQAFNPNHPLSFIAILMMMLSFCIFSGLWPFHKWLLSSLNAPTPVSALMHAGLINGSGIMYLMFHPILEEFSFVVQLCFLIGLMSLLLGNLWKLMQNDYKRLLACSTVAQMGFMVLQLSLGLYASALFHIMGHSLFKSYLFLNSGSMLEKEAPNHSKPIFDFKCYLISILIGLIGASAFYFARDLEGIHWNASLILVGFSWIACSQIAYSFSRLKSGLSLKAIIYPICFALFHGFAIKIFETSLSITDTPIDLSLLTLIGFAACFMAWTAMISRDLWVRHIDFKWIQKWYWHHLNSSQPHSSTITSIRQDYQY
jgi:NAD(P)H-quinone oxidoreductase subunit 5